jgi:hypothetical protein
MTVRVVRNRGVREVGGGEALVSAGGHGGRGHHALSHSSTKLVDAEPQGAGGASGTYELFGAGGEPPYPVLREPQVSTRRRLIRFKSPFATGSDNRVLAHGKEPGRGPSADEPYVGKPRGWRAGNSVDILETESAVTSGRGFDRLQGSSRNGTENCRLADAQAIGYLPRSDQCVQDVCRTKRINSMCIAPYARRPLVFHERSRRIVVENTQKSAIVLTDSAPKLPLGERSDGQRILRKGG